MGSRPSSRRDGPASCDCKHRASSVASTARPVQLGSRRGSSVQKEAAMRDLESKKEDTSESRQSVELKGNRSSTVLPLPDQPPVPGTKAAAGVAYNRTGTLANTGSRICRHRSACQLVVTGKLRWRIECPTRPQPAQTSREIPGSRHWPAGIAYDHRCNHRQEGVCSQYVPLPTLLRRHPVNRMTP